MSSRPDTPLPNSNPSWPDAYLNVSRADCASGDSVPLRNEMIAPAPIQSSIAHRSAPDAQCSPAAITDTFEPKYMAARATASAFRKHPVRTGVLAARTLNAAPFGEAKTMREPASAWRKLAGEREKLLLPRDPAARAPTSCANAEALSRSAQG